MNPLLKIERARQEIVLNQPFYGSLLLLLDPKAVTKQQCPNITDFATNGKELLYYIEGVDKLSEDEIVGTLCHEVLHCAFGHMFRLRLKDFIRWNWACDYVINPIIVESGLKMPADSLFDKKYAGMSAEQVYNLLENEDGSSKKYLNARMDIFAPPSELTAEQELQEIENWKTSTLQAAIYAKSHGTLPGSLENMLKELVKTKMPWKEILANFLFQNKPSFNDWSRPSHRSIGAGLYLPNRYREPTGEVVLVHDTSASCSDKDIENYYGETAGIIQQIRPERCILIQCDTYIRQIDEYTYDTFPDNPKDLLIKGRGGTNFQPPFDYLEKEGIIPSALVYFTDGECSYPTPVDYPVLWALTYEQEKPPFGEYLCLST
jgi:predicted metal-dependent peptidase